MQKTSLKTLAALFGMATTTKAEFNGMSADECIQNDFVYVSGSSQTSASSLDYTKFAKGGCCEEFDPSDSNCLENCSGSNTAFCISKDDGITNRDLRKFLDAADEQNCPVANKDTRIEITESDVAVEKVFNFNGVLPNEDAKNWHCKWKVTTDPSLVPAGVDEEQEVRETNGWIVLEATTAGFDQDILIHMQPPGKFYNYNFRTESTDPTTQTFLGRHIPGQKYVLPAEYDIYIEVNPYKLISDSENSESGDGEGFVQFTVTHTMENPTPEEPNLREWASVHRHNHELTDGEEVHVGIDFTDADPHVVDDHEHEAEQQTDPVVDDSGETETEQPTDPVVDETVETEDQESTDPVVDETEDQEQSDVVVEPSEDEEQNNQNQGEANSTQANENSTTPSTNPEGEEGNAGQTDSQGTVIDDQNPQAPTEEEKTSMVGPIGIVALIAVVGGGIYYKQKQSANLMEGGNKELSKKVLKKMFKASVKSKNGKNLKENMV